MTAFLWSIAASLRSALLGLKVPGIYVLLALSLLAWILAYQVKREYTVDLGGLTDDAYVSGFHAKERNADLNYRWTGSTSEVLFPGIGNEPALLSITTVGFRPSEPSPEIDLTARGKTFHITTQSSPHTDTLLLERGDKWEPNLTVVISSPTFTPPGDARRLGVILDRITVTPASYGLRPLVIPPPLVLAELSLGVLATYVCLLITVRRRLLALALAAIVAAATTTLLVVARPEEALHAAQLPSLWAWGLLFGLLGRAVLDVLIKDPSARVDLAAGLGSAAFAFAFMLRFGGLTYPQFQTSDILLHVHNVQNVLGGRLLFTENLPDGTPVPYPNAYYVLIAPLAALIGRSDDSIALLLKWTASLQDASLCLALAWSGSRLWRSGAGWAAPVVYAAAPAALILFSAGNYSNLFAQVAFSWTVLVAIVLADKGVPRPLPVALLLGAGFVLTMLGHYGMMLATLVVGAFYAVWVLYISVRRGPSEARYGWGLVASIAGALLVSIAVYYRNFGPEIAHQWGQLFGRLSGQGGAPAPSSPADQTSGFIDFAGKRLSWLGPMLSLCAAAGALVTGRLRGDRALLWSWLLAVGLFALLDQRLGDTVRWYYLAAAALALLAGRYLSLLNLRGRMSRVLVSLALAAIVLHTLTFWVGDLIFTRYHQ